MCGEQAKGRSKTNLTMGSSPRVRGTAGVFPPGKNASGIIPACAGNRWQTEDTAGSPGDHPRVCGEQKGKWKPVQTGGGSSPRVRGTDKVGDKWYYFNGIIPACAGNSFDRHQLTLADWDHPRVCGEQALV